MTSEDILPIVNRFLHLLAAITLFGGSLFMRLALHPGAAEALGEEERKRLRAAVMRRWSRVVNIMLVVLIATGLITFMKTVMPALKNSAESDANYHSMFGLKFLAALGMFFIASALAGRAKVFERMRQDTNLWLNVNILLGLLIVALAVLLRYERHAG